MYGNDPEIFSISIMVKVLENRNFGTIFFPVKRKFPEHCSGIKDHYGIPECSGNFQNVPEYRSGNFRFPEHLVPELH